MGGPTGGAIGEPTGETVGGLARGAIGAMEGMTRVTGEGGPIGGMPMEGLAGGAMEEATSSDSGVSLGVASLDSKVIRGAAREVVGTGSKVEGKATSPGSKVPGGAR